jgi:hypothetical protein
MKIGHSPPSPLQCGKNFFKIMENYQVGVDQKEKKKKKGSVNAPYLPAASVPGASRLVTAPVCS